MKFQHIGSVYTFFFAALLCLQVNAVSYTNGINDSSWRSELSVFECKLVQSVPYYGEAIFKTRAGEALGFRLKAKTSRFKSGEAGVVSKTPLWKHHTDAEALGSVAVKKSKQPVLIGRLRAEKMLSELNKGMELAFIREAWYEGEVSPPVHLAINSIGFREEYRKYLECLASLLPANFDQLKRTSLYFSVDMPKIDDPLPIKIQQQLDNILQLIKHDSKIRFLYIDGHASSPADRTHNLALSKMRADLVEQYLVRRGISPDWITKRWHGERYPVSSNYSIAGRAKNRRVTVRLERIDTMEALPLAVNDK